MSYPDAIIIYSQNTFIYVKCFMTAFNKWMAFQYREVY